MSNINISNKYYIVTAFDQNLTCGNTEKCGPLLVKVT